MKRFLNMIVIMLVALAGTGLFTLKYRAGDRDAEIQALHAQIVADQKAIRVLKAEWAFLNSPDYLQDMAEKHLGLRPITPDQIIGDLSDLPWRRAGGVIAPPQVDRVMPRPRFKPGTDLFSVPSAEAPQSGVISFDGSMGANSDVLQLLNDFDGGER